MSLYSSGPVGPKIVEAALNWLTPLQTMYNKKWPIKPIKVPFKNQSNGCTAYLRPIRHCTEVRLTSVQSTTMQQLQILKKSCKICMYSSLKLCSYKCYQSWFRFMQCMKVKLKSFQHFVFYKYFCLILGLLLKSKISKKSMEGPGRKLNFKLFHSGFLCIGPSLHIKKMLFYTSTIS